MTKFTGIVERIYEKQWKDGAPSYTLRLEGSPLYHRMGKNRYTNIAEVGNPVEFDAEENEDGKSTTISKAGVHRTSMRNPAPAASGESRPGPVATVTTSSASRDESIHYQSSRKDALEFLSIAVTSGAVKLPAKDAAKLAFLEAALDRYTAAFYRDIGTKGALERSTVADSPKESDLPDDEE